MGYGGGVKPQKDAFIISIILLDNIFNYQAVKWSDADVNDNKGNKIG
jgi:hypothetical protein